MKKRGVQDKYRKAFLFKIHLHYVSKSIQEEILKTSIQILLLRKASVHFINIYALFF